MCARNVHSMDVQDCLCSFYADARFACLCGHCLSLRLACQAQLHGNAQRKLCAHFMSPVAPTSQVLCTSVTDYACDNHQCEPAVLVLRTRVVLLSAYHTLLASATLVTGRLLQSAKQLQPVDDFAAPGSVPNLLYTCTRSHVSSVSVVSQLGLFWCPFGHGNGRCKVARCDMSLSSPVGSMDAKVMQVGCWLPTALCAISAVTCGNTS
jgi:hypothetical protein